MKEEIIGGIKNAIERGASLDVAVQSFIDAGYNANEVHEAAQIISRGATTIASPQQIPKQFTSLPKLTQTPQTTQTASLIKPAVQQPLPTISSQPSPTQAPVISAPPAQVSQVKQYSPPTSQPQQIIQSRPLQQMQRPISIAPPVMSSAPNLFIQQGPIPFQPPSSKKPTTGLIITLLVALFAVGAALVFIILFKEKLISLFQ